MFLATDVVRMHNQSYKFLWSSFNQSSFTWVKSQPILEVNLIAHINGEHHGEVTPLSSSTPCVNKVCYPYITCPI